jgi:hypothetical protein
MGVWVGVGVVWVAAMGIELELLAVDLGGRVKVPKANPVMSPERANRVMIISMKGWT